MLRTRFCILLLASMALTLPTAAASAGIRKDTPVKILALGDSITYGLGTSNGGYRKQLQSRLTAAGYQYDFVGSRSDNSAGLADPQHEGWSGYHIVDQKNATPKQIYGDVTLNALRNYNPDLVLLLIGTNDMISWDEPKPNTSIQTHVDDYGRLLAQILEERPGVQVIAAPILHINGIVSENKVNTFNTGIKAQVDAYAAKGLSITWAGGMTAAAGRNSTDLPDGVHPSADTYSRMGDVWFGSVEAITVPEPAGASAAAVILLLGRRRVRRD